VRRFTAGYRGTLPAYLCGIRVVTDGLEPASGSHNPILPD